MFRKTDNHKRTASISKDGRTVVFRFSDGRVNGYLTVRDAEAGRALLAAKGYKEYRA